MIQSKEELALLEKIECLKKKILKIIEENGNDMHCPYTQKLDEELEKSIDEYHSLYQLPRLRKALSRGEFITSAQRP